jgi:hypothetical protein
MIECVALGWFPTHSRCEGNFTQLEVHPRIARLEVPVVRLSVLQLNKHRSVLRLPQQSERKHGSCPPPLTHIHNFQCWPPYHDHKVHRLRLIDELLAPTPSSAQRSSRWPGCKRWLPWPHYCLRTPQEWPSVLISVGCAHIKTARTSSNNICMHTQTSSTHTRHTCQKRTCCGCHERLRCLLPCSRCVAPLFDSQQVPHACHVDLIAVLWRHGKLHYTCCLMAR